VLIGIILISGLLPTHGFQNERMVKVFGGIFILYGVYRIVVYKARLKQLKREEDEKD
jgi:hypothetical protein